MINVFSIPTLSNAKKGTFTGISQVVTRVAGYLPQFGYQYNDDPNTAQLIVSHAGSQNGLCDVAHCHGLYPTAERGFKSSQFYTAANERVVNDILGAQQVTVPSQWVAHLLRRDLHMEPNVIGWAVDWDEWQGGTPQGYVLWNKNRPGDVCDTMPVNDLAKLATQVKFKSTFGADTSNVQTIGTLPFEDMREVIKNASVYLATTKETFGIGTLEALAAGVPVLGYDWGGTTDIIEHGINGYLVQPGDVQGLLEGLAWVIQHRDTLSHNARISAKRYNWLEVARKFAMVYDAAMATWQDDIKVSVVIPCYNYSAYVREAIESVLAQDTTFKFELIVIDDGSTDDSADVINSIDGTFHFIRQRNQGVSATRNNGIALARGEFIACLDADDVMDQGWLQTCYDALSRRGEQIDIAYTKLRIMGYEHAHTWPHKFDKERMMAGKNQIPSLCMFKRVYWERTGGYRKRYQPAEDARFWLDMVERGARAELVSGAPLFVYRVHGESATAPIHRREKREPQWHDKSWLTGKRQQPFGSPTAEFGVYNYDEPRISVVIPCSEAHLPNLWDALDSVENQTFVHWEVIVVFDFVSYPDNGKVTARLREAYPFVKWRHTDTTASGAGVARNVGIEAVDGDFIVFLDADDVLHHEFMERTLKLYQRTGRYVYTDWILNDGGTLEHHETPEFEQRLIFKDGQFHAVTCLLPAEAVRDVGGFDEQLVSWEDWDFFIKLHINGWCGARLSEALFVYNRLSGSRREAGYAIKDDLKVFLKKRYEDYRSKKRDMCGCREQKQAIIESDVSEMVKISYAGPAGMHEVRGVSSKRFYGRHKTGDDFFVETVDLGQTDHSGKKLFVPVAQYEKEITKTVIPAEPVKL